MLQEQQTDPLETLRDIRSIMERSARFISLSGWSGVWAGCAALAGSYIAYKWLNDIPEGMTNAAYNELITRFVVLALAVLVTAFVGGVFFTWRKTRSEGATFWNNVSRRMMIEMAIPLAAGGVFALHFLYNGLEAYIAPTCLAFYGFALINGSKYTLTDIKYLGLCEVVLGCVCLFAPGNGLTFWAIGFGVLHIIYGIAMWNKYDKRITGQEETR